MKVTLHRVIHRTKEMEESKEIRDMQVALHSVMSRMKGNRAVKGNLRYATSVTTTQISSCPFRRCGSEVSTSYLGTPS
jgi:hypothetical protein